MPSKPRKRGRPKLPPVDEETAERFRALIAEGRCIRPAARELGLREAEWRAVLGWPPKGPQPQEASERAEASERSEPSSNS